jgi:predicted nucleic acid-binding Zn ribbon protein
MKPVGRAVDRLLRGLGIATEVARVGAVDAWPAVATAAFGADAATTRAVAIDDATLVVAVPTSAWASEIRLRETELVAALRRSAPSSGIRAIRTVPTR